MSLICCAQLAESRMVGYYRTVINLRSPDKVMYGDSCMACVEIIVLGRWFLGHCRFVQFSFLRGGYITEWRDGWSSAWRDKCYCRDFLSKTGSWSALRHHHLIEESLHQRVELVIHFHYDLLQTFSNVVCLINHITSSLFTIYNSRSIHHIALKVYSLQFISAFLSCI